MISITLILIFFATVILFGIEKINDHFWFSKLDKILLIIFKIAFTLIIIALIGIVLYELGIRFRVLI